MGEGINPATDADTEKTMSIEEGAMDEVVIEATVASGPKLPKDRRQVKPPTERRTKARRDAHEAFKK